MKKWWVDNHETVQNTNEHGQKHFFKTAFIFVKNQYLTADLNLYEMVVLWRSKNMIYVCERYQTRRTSVVSMLCGFL